MTSIGPVSTTTPQAAPRVEQDEQERVAAQRAATQSESVDLVEDARFPLAGSPAPSTAAEPEKEGGFFGGVRRLFQGMRPAAKPAAEAQSATPDEASETTSSKAGFEDAIREIAGPSKKGLINEERLYAAVLHARIGEKHGPEASAAFKEAFEGTREPGQRKGYEARAQEALHELIEGGVLTKRQATKLHSEAFAAAQLDENKDELFDGRGGEGDDSVARAPFEDAVAKAQKRLSAFDAGEKKPERRPLGPLLDVDLEGDLEDEQKKEIDALMQGKDVTDKKAEATKAAPRAQMRAAAAAGPAIPKGPTQNLFGDGFLWKPVSETTGQLVTLLPPEMTGKVAGVVLRDASGQILEQGDYASVANGGREHFRFDQPGAAYPPGVTVEVQLTDGSTKSYRIPDPSMRAE
ncbi:MAG: hypothetical protein H6832_02825 [Planctomycetes bacterium]|nr:hypothetical protein [Planctomycetota bacterium]MCB9917315.1 hypothetical protein [Planctomycetota bacterium]